MNSLRALQARNGLWQLLWQVALDEAYTAKDSRRRMAELAGLPSDEVVNVYFGHHPELRQWAEDHIAAGTCEQAITDLQDELKATQERRARDRDRADRIAQMTPQELCEPPPTDAPDWMKPFMLGPVSVERIEKILQGEDAPPDETKAQVAHPPATPKNSEHPKNRGGRPPKWDWDAFNAEVVRIANTPDGLPERRSDLMHKMLDWCSEHWGDAPAESVVRDRLSRLCPG